MMGWANSDDYSETNFSYGRGGYAKSEEGIIRDVHGTILNSVPSVPVEYIPCDWSLVIAQAAIEWRHEHDEMSDDDLEWELAMSLLCWENEGKVSELMAFLKSRGWDRLSDIVEQICALELFHYEPCNLAF